MVIYVPSEVILVAPYIFLYTSGTVALTIGVVVVVVLVVELFEQAAAKKLNIKIYVILGVIGEGLTN
jgi:predicted membrane channel-forming protein YqfA (hemolysin III family)